MANSSRLNDLVVAAYLEKCATKTVANGFKRSKGFTNMKLDNYHKLPEIISFFNSKAPAEEEEFAFFFVSPL